MLQALAEGMAARGRYAGWFDRDVTKKDTSGVIKWYVKLSLTDAEKVHLAEIATAATLQLPVAEIAALTEGTKDVTVEGCEPGFYYTLYGAATMPKRGGQGQAAIPDGAAYRAEPCGEDGKVVFPAVEKPSDAAGFFTVGVSVTNADLLATAGQRALQE